MYYKLSNTEIDILKNIQKIVPIKYEILGDFISIDSLLNYLFDLYDEYMKFIELATK